MADTDSGSKQEDLLTPEEVAGQLRTTPKKLNYWRGTDQGPPSFKLTEREFRYERVKFERWLAKRKAATIGEDDE